jgi:hypothetical protein
VETLYPLTTNVFELMSPYINTFSLLVYQYEDAVSSLKLVNVTNPGFWAKSIVLTFQQDLQNGIDNANQFLERASKLVFPEYLNNSTNCP